ncbi:PH domain-containing protein [Chryseobacterium sp. MMS23-Vi53]|uniref:PH domain-containing protein n=1 Tax=Chryseobacterium sp. MMS23-Vi53 TaxID=3386644 RepID=UPI0039ED8454
MSTICALCGNPLTSMDTLLGENKLSDGQILCNKCLNEATNVNKELVNNLATYNLAEIRGILLQGKLGIYEEPELPQVTGFQQNINLSSNSGESSYQYRADAPSRLDEIKDQIVALNARLSIFVNMEVNELEKILDKDERLIAIAEGKYLYNNQEGIVISTQKRVVFFDKKFFGGVDKNEFLLEKISSIDYDTGLLTSELKIRTAAGTAEFKLYNKTAAQIFCDAVKNYLGRPANQVQQTQSFQSKAPEPQSSFNNLYNTKRPETQSYQQSVPQQKVQPTSNVPKESAEVIFQQLEKLGKLREMGVLTEEEFAEQKKKLLERL